MEGNGMRRAGLFLAGYNEVCGRNRMKTKYINSYYLLMK